MFLCITVGTQELKCSAVKDKKSSKEKEDGPQLVT